MADPMSNESVRSPDDNWLEPGKTNIQLVYILYLLSFVVGITSIVGVVIAYLNKTKATGWMQSHYTWAIRTFWIGILYGFISLMLTVVFIGFLGMLATIIWVVVRCVVGLQKAGNQEPIADPYKWLI
jgi:uncharacterized membrane protein